MRAVMLVRDALSSSPSVVAMAHASHSFTMIFTAARSDCARSANAWMSCADHAELSTACASAAFAFFMAAAASETRWSTSVGRLGDERILDHLQLQGDPAGPRGEVARQQVAQPVDRRPHLPHDRRHSLLAFPLDPEPADVLDDGADGLQLLVAELLLRFR